MKFKLTLSNEFHKDTATCIGWNTTEEVFSCGDDNQLFKWNVTNNERTQFIELPKDLFPIDLQWFSRNSVMSRHGDVMLITAADGKFHFMNRNGRIERSIEAHKGAVLVGRWSPDGAGLLTAGEDGLIKIWSKSGMLRSIVASNDLPVYSAAWSPDSQSILYTQGRIVVIKQLAPNTKPIKWRAHDGTILCVAWSLSVDLIVTGSEDCRYKVWDAMGRALFASSSHDYPITSLAWAPQGDLFAIGAYNTLRLCDFSGWSHCLEKIDTGSLYNIAWSSDGTQLAAACATGHVIFAHLIDRHFHWKNFSATVNEKKSILVRDVLNDTEEQLDFSENIIKVAIAYGYLIVTTPIQCYIYSTTNWNTPTIFDLKDGIVNHLLLSEKCFLIVERTNVTVYTYQGRVIASPRWTSMNPENLSQSQVSLSSDTLCICDQNDSKMVNIFDMSSGRSIQDSLSNIQHSLPITNIALSQGGAPSDRQITIIDKNKDLFLVPIRATNKYFCKLGGQIQSLKWNADYNMIAAIQDVRLIVWYCPSAVVFDEQLLKLASLQYDSAELGRGPRVIDFNGSTVSVRRSDGSLLNTAVSPYPIVLHENISLNKWTEALNLCRLLEDSTLWACIAVLATLAKMDALDIAEEAYAAINQFDKVTYIQHIKSMPKRAQQMSAIALLAGSLQEAETILLQNGMVYEAIETNVLMHNWNRALDIAMKHETHVDTVLYLRQKYLSSIDKTEKNEKFIQLKDKIPIDENKITEKIEMELQKNK